MSFPCGGTKRGRGLIPGKIKAIGEHGQSLAKWALNLGDREDREERPGPQC